MYKLRIYKLKGADKGNLDHEEFSRQEKKWNQDTKNVLKS